MKKNEMNTQQKLGILEQGRDSFFCIIQHAEDMKWCENVSLLCVEY